ncbi:MAG: type IX secretion system PorP/SprF family membrane protein [Parvicellaceae bacterium]|jgi:type IX secretion system PorP/SprF family membrane protein
MKTMRKIAITLVLGLFGLGSMAQQDVQLTHYMFDKLSVNPGYAGLNNAICGTVVLRSQWATFDGAPKTGLINFHMPVDVLRGGVGITYYYDQLGFEKNNIARLHYSFHKAIGIGTLGIGASVGLISKNISAMWVTPDGTSTAAGTVVDPSISDANSSDMAADFSFGAFYQANNLWMGISSTHLTQSELKDINIKSARHYWVMAGYNYDINPEWQLKPSVIAKSDGASTQLDINVSVMFKKMVWAGVSYRLADAIAPMIGYQTLVGKDQAGLLKIGYSYDVTTSKLNNYSNGSHEIMVNYCFNLDRPEPLSKYKNPRFL